MFKEQHDGTVDLTGSNRVMHRKTDNSVGIMSLCDWGWGDLGGFELSFIVKGNMPRISSYTWLFAKNTGWFVVLRSNP